MSLDKDLDMLVGAIQAGGTLSASQLQAVTLAAFRLRDHVKELKEKAVAEPDTSALDALQETHDKLVAAHDKLQKEFDEQSKELDERKIEVRTLKGKVTP